MIKKGEAETRSEREGGNKEKARMHPLPLLLHLLEFKKLISDLEPVGLTQGRKAIPLPQRPRRGAEESNHLGVVIAFIKGRLSNHCSH